MRNKYFTLLLNVRRRLPLRWTLAFLIFSAPLSALDPDERSVTKAAEGVYVIRHKFVPFEGGNTTVVIGRNAVLVVDSCGRPPVTRYDLERIRELTDKPVRYLLNTHWHSDHNIGNYLYARAYPGIMIIAHHETKTEMDLYSKTYKPRLERRLQAAKDALAQTADRDGKPFSDQAREAQRQRLAALEAEAQDFSDYEYQPPTRLFGTEMEIDLGGRKVQIRHLGRGNTSGDAVAYVPDAKVLAVGDLVVHPIPYTYDGYPTEWVKTLERIASFDALVIVPGHGALLRDKQYVFLVRDFLQSAIDQLKAQLRIVGPALFRRFEDVEKGIDLSAFRSRFVGKDAELNEDFTEIEGRLKVLVFREAQLR